MHARSAAFTRPGMPLASGLPVVGREHALSQGFSIAQKLGVPCVVLSACLVPFTMPAWFPDALNAESPALFAALQQAAQQPAAGCVSWTDIELWMFRLFMSDIGTDRERLGLEPIPFPEEGSGLPPPPAVLFTFSGSLVERPAHWPTHWHVCGVWESAESESGSSVPIPDVLAAFLEEDSERAPALVTFGSFTNEKRTAADPAHLAEMVACALRMAGKRAIFHGVEPRGGPWEAVVLAADTFVDYGALLPRCSAVVHAGGAGLVHACMRAAVPQLIIPFHFDQSSWADRVEWVGIGAQAARAEVITRTNNAMHVATPLADALAPEVRAKLLQLREHVVEEGQRGVDVAVKVIRDLVGY
jgi:sterol 3beta-glucosyltransferase